MENKTSHLKENQPASCEGISKTMLQQIEGEDIVSETVQRGSINRSCDRIKQAEEAARSNAD